MHAHSIKKEGNVSHTPDEAVVTYLQHFFKDMEIDKTNSVSEYETMKRWTIAEKAKFIVEITGFTYYHSEQRDHVLETIFEAVCFKLTSKEKMEIVMMLLYVIGEKYGEIDADTEHSLYIRAVSFFDDMCDL